MRRDRTKFVFDHDRELNLCGNPWVFTNCLGGFGSDSRFQTDTCLVTTDVRLGSKADVFHACPKGPLSGVKQT